jgi:hypothetical protein
VSSVLLNIVVFRAVEIDRAAHFYEQLVLHIDKQQHGNGPEITQLIWGLSFSRNIHIRMGLERQKESDLVLLWNRCQS